MYIHGVPSMYVSDNIGDAVVDVFSTTPPSVCLLPPRGVTKLQARCCVCNFLLKKVCVLIPAVG